MLETLHLKNVGPAKEMKLEFAPRLNVITGDNGLGKSFILDCAWFGLSLTWSQEIDANLLSGGMVRPIKNEPTLISVSYLLQNETSMQQFEFFHQKQNWFNTTQQSALESLRNLPRIDMPYQGIVIQCHIGGGFSIWDSARHFQTKSHQPEVFTETTVWKGSQDFPEGLIRDLASWQRENGKVLKQFQVVLECLSPSQSEQLKLGELTRVRIEDRKDTPTIQMPYGESIPITQASSGIRRIIAFAYILVWAWREHLLVSNLLKQEPQKQLTFLIDEIESHLHPKWQQVIVKALLNVAKALSDELEVQIILTTHSPLVLQSLETVFDSDKDAWFDLDFDPIKKEVVLEKRDYFKRGSLNNWITSEAFDLPSSYTQEAKAVMDEVSNALKGELTLEQAQKLNAELQDVLGDIDIFWSRWHSALERRGLVL